MSNSNSDDAQLGDGPGQIANRTMSVEIKNTETGEVRPAQLTDTGILFDEIGVFSEGWFIANPVGRNLEEKI